MAFSLSRKEGFPSQFGELYPSVDIDVVEIGIITFGIILFSSLISITSINSRFYSYGFRLLISVFIGTIILFNNYGQKWEHNSIKTNVTSINKSINRTEIDVEIGIKIGLRSINVTLKSLEDKKIDYNEEFKWTWDQGIIGFGLHSGHLQQSFRKSQYRGLPIPILEVVDNLIIDGENFRYGRFYRNAGWYTHKLLNITFFIWVFAVFKFRALVMYKALIILSAGLLQIIANVVWCYIKNPIPLKIIFENGQLVPKYGLNFWLNLFSGIFCTLLAIIIFIAYHWYQGPTVLFFGLDPLSEFEEEIHLCEIKTNECNEMNEQGQKSLTNDVELNEITRMANNSDIVEYHCLRERKKSFIRKRRYRNLVTSQNFSDSSRSGSTIQLTHT